MIYDKISNWKCYFKNPKFVDIFQELNKLTESTENGNYYFDGYYFKVMEYDTKENPDIIETHRKEVDIQVVLKGGEMIKMYHLEDLEVKKEYNDENDSIFYRSTKPPYSEIQLTPNYMGVFFPSDAHHPQFCIGNKVEKLKKIVIKVNIEYFQ
jgi:YhcH/YjgK/YiaL family protein